VTNRRYSQLKRFNGGRKMKTLEEIKKILSGHKEELKERYKIKEIRIFGSFIRGEQKKRSDIDILVDFYELPDLLKFIEIERYVEELLGVKVDLVRKPALRIELKDSILSEAVEI
jgi:predicted nucleotidyltransferase